MRKYELQKCSRGDIIDWVGHDTDAKACGMLIKLPGMKF
jgi:hypothetical protein